MPAPTARFAWLERSEVDVLAMQVNECRDDQFPYAAFEKSGYEVAMSA